MNSESVQEKKFPALSSVLESQEESLQFTFFGDAYSNPNLGKENVLWYFVCCFAGFLVKNFNSTFVL